MGKAPDLDALITEISNDRAGIHESTTTLTLFGILVALRDIKAQLASLDETLVAK